jgi:hypothetical protein
VFGVSRISKTLVKQKDNGRGRQNLVAAEVATDFGITYTVTFLELRSKAR